MELEREEHLDYETEEEGETKKDHFKFKIYNRLEDNFHLSNKKALFWNISEYYKS